MPKKRTRTIAVVAGLGAAALVLVVLSTGWRVVYYAILPRESLWGEWTCIDWFHSRGDSVRSTTFELTGVTFARAKGTRVACLVRSFGVVDMVRRPPGAHWYSVSFTAREPATERVPRYRIELPDLSNPRMGWYFDGKIGGERKLPPVQVRFRFEENGRLVLEHDGPFLPGGANTLILKRASERE